MSSKEIQRRKKLSQLFPSCVFPQKKKKKKGTSESGTAGTSLVSQFILNQLFYMDILIRYVAFTSGYTSFVCCLKLFISIIFALWPLYLFIIFFLFFFFLFSSVWLHNGPMRWIYIHTYSAAQRTKNYLFVHQVFCGSWTEPPTQLQLFFSLLFPLLLAFWPVGCWGREFLCNTKSSRHHHHPLTAIRIRNERLPFLPFSLLYLLKIPMI